MASGLWFAATGQFVPDGDPVSRHSATFSADRDDALPIGRNLTHSCPLRTTAIGGLDGYAILKPYAISTACNVYCR